MTLLMGVLNVTPDSFYDGGLWSDPGIAAARGLEMAEQGAGIIDVGGESTRPGAPAVEEGEELRRVVPVVRSLAGQLAGRARISVDTRKRAVAEAAVEAGASVINDVSASLWPVAAQAKVAWMAMHMRGEPANMASLAHYDDVVGEVSNFLAARAEQAAGAGVEEIWVDPGIGFAKTTAHNLALLAHLGDIVAGSRWPVAVGVSRKRFTGVLASGSEAEPAPVEDRLEGSLAAAVWAMRCGADVVRTHDVSAAAVATRLMGQR
jgi:dihydropteroate synthase